MVTLPETLAEAARALRDGLISSVELTDAVLERADRLDGELGVFLCRATDTAKAAAERADRERADGVDRGPLHGVPVAIKDIIATDDCPTTAQSLVLDPMWGTRGDAPVVAALRAAGAIILGKTTTMEFALGLPDPTKPFPIPRNPWDTERWAGGSSSGNGSGLACGLFYGAVGTDTGGSIRVPAALCGITGLKPTYGLLSRDGVLPYSWSLDHVGPMARTARDCAVLLDALVGGGTACGDLLDGDIAELRIGAQRRHHVDVPFVDPVAVDRYEAALDDLAAAGAYVVEVDLPAFDVAFEACQVVFMSEALAYHRRALRDRWEDYGCYTRIMIATAAFYTASDYVQARRVLSRVRAQALEVYRDVDVVATPTVGAGAPSVDGLDFVTALTLPVFTPVWNGLGFPAVSMPCGFTTAGLPVGLQLAGRPMEDGTVLRAADAYQRRTDWHCRRPALASG